MAFYLKKTKLKGRTYLSIDESFYSHEKRGTAHKCYKSLGSVETLTANGMEDPIAFYKKEVAMLNEQRKKETVPKISNVSPKKYAGYFPLKSILEKLDVKKYIQLFNLVNDSKYDIYEVISLLIFARAVNPCSKYKTFYEVIPSLLEKCNFSYDQSMDCLEYIGKNYEKFVELFTLQAKKMYNLDTSKTYFDCTNFYFEIDREDDFRKKGPSKENRHDPIVGLGLLLDSNQIPIGMKIYPGNQSEQPVMREVIDKLKKKNNISGKTVHVADKGLNSAENILFSQKNGNGYIFSKSVKKLAETEKKWVLNKDGYIDVRNRENVLLYKYKSVIDKFPYTFNINGKKIKTEITEKRIVTFNPSLASKKKYEIQKMADKAAGLTMSQAKREEFGEAGKYVIFTNESGKKANVTLNSEAIKKDIELAGYNLIVTSETKMPDKEVYEAYHNLWRIEESFRIMKTDLDARPAFVRKESTIKGHFLICYLNVLLERLFQFKELKNKFSSSEVFEFIRKFNVIKADDKYINLATISDLIQYFDTSTKLPLTNFNLTETQVNSIMNYKFL